MGESERKLRGQGAGWSFWEDMETLNKSYKVDCVGHVLERTRLIRVLRKKWGNKNELLEPKMSTEFIM